MTTPDFIKIQRSYKFRFYPKSAQDKQLAIEFGCARWVWNTCLAWCTRKYRVHCQHASAIDFSRELTFLKKLGTYHWLKEASATVLSQKLRDGAFLTLPQRGPLKLKGSRTPGGSPKRVTLTKDCTGRYFISFMCIETIQPMPRKPNGIGMDRGVQAIVATASGWRSGNPRHLKAHSRRLKKAQRRLSCKVKGTNRWHRQRASVAKAFARGRERRQDFLHTLSTFLVGCAGFLAIEDLNLKGMMANRKIAKSIGDVGMHELKRQLDHKAQWYGVKCVQVNRWAPTRKMCSEYGTVQKEMPLKIRAWACPDCQTVHDRDINAAKNILMLATLGRRESDAHGGVYPLEAAV